MRSIHLALLACLLLSACGGVDPDSPEGLRQSLFKQMLKTSEELGGMLRGRIRYDERRFAEGARHLDELASQPWQHFPQVDADQRSTARPEVWQQQAHFQQLADELESATAALLRVATQADVARGDLQAPLQRVESACKTCHESFRAY
ncbi:c-type cytochrome [Phytopseudomonas dryadis]|uniref:Cytochrome C n=1 Tax=Phytopseudomonas dryadis TaxID=2487520 RepID=A0A4Q9QV93_9GAMM|nr:MULTISPECIES: cytochrome c [Pseudomonas]TBU87665.1 cytochrome C [Pseudomonas dryadis]TBV01929.1 cytochrome C [Pseudomonas dryadis]TBV13852.1 cytochrome C [Pseudomonas sp. FRB 230]